MSNDYHFFKESPVDINFGIHTRSKLISTIKNKRCLIITSKNGRKRIENDLILGELISNKRHIWIDNINTNPSCEDINLNILSVYNLKPEFVLAIGGGSVIDSAKVIRLALSTKSILRTFDKLLNCDELNQHNLSIPLIALPTTAGTGSEVTQYASIWDNLSKKKISLTGLGMFPTNAYVDPELIKGLNKDVILSSGLDAINQAFDSLNNKSMTLLSEQLSIRSLVLGFDAFKKLMKNNFDLDACYMMSLSSLLSGIAISITRTSLCHSISYPLTAHFSIPHGLACAFTMPTILKYCLKNDDGRFSNLSKYLINSGNNNELLIKFTQLNSEFNVNKLVKSKICSLELLKKYSSEMLTKGRADNCLFNVNLNILEKILEESWSSEL
jgi:alcohol dehydrogenase